MNQIEQPLALKLADALDAGDSFYFESSLSWNRILSDACSDAATELRRLHAENEALREALEKLARLGNGDQYGNSIGNEIARAALARAGEVK